MSLVALTTPTAQLGGLSGAPYVLASGTALSGSTGFTCPWVNGLMLVVVSGATAAGALYFERAYHLLYRTFYYGCHYYGLRDFRSHSC